VAHSETGSATPTPSLDTQSRTVRASWGRPTAGFTCWCVHHVVRWRNVDAATAKPVRAAVKRAKATHQPDHSHLRATVVSRPAQQTKTTTSRTRDHLEARP